jgi:transposase
VSPSPNPACPGAALKKFRWRRPRHTLKGRQDANAVDRVGLRLTLRKAQSEAGDIVLLFADESEALTHPYLARAWAKRGADLRVPAPGQAKKVAIMGAFDHAARRLVVHTSKTKRSADFIALLERLDGLYGPRAGLPIKPVVIVLDNGPIHVSKAATAGLAARAHWLTVEWLPKYAPELNDIEPVWRDLKAHHLAHQTFTDADDLNRAILAAAANLNTERNISPLPKQLLRAALCHWLVPLCEEGWPPHKISARRAAGADSLQDGGVDALAILGCLRLDQHRRTDRAAMY